MANWSDRKSQKRQRDRTYDRFQRRNAPALARAKRIRSGATWQKVREFVWQRQSPLRQSLQFKAHQDRIATQVHHIKPLVTHPELASTPRASCRCAIGVPRDGGSVR